MRPWRRCWICRWVHRWRMWSAGLGSTAPPIMLLRTWLTSRLAAMLEARDFEDRLFVQVFQRANLTIARSREAPLACCVADAHQARELDVAPGVPLVRVRRIGYSVADVPISLTYCDFSPERYTREVDIRVLQTD